MFFLQQPGFQVVPLLGGLAHGEGLAGQHTMAPDIAEQLRLVKCPGHDTQGVGPVDQPAKRGIAAPKRNRGYPCSTSKPEPPPTN